eukprot:Gregarina_sp_Pseudo_9__5544@NODE_734_length_2301_cov_6_823165_g690_i0_p1_GENE_NODE_734_length_2301_cov_6_823165_g690_i0NODE_734_length_2301_cov_6_823165_g690_i0_p1_ORF_typecomplete_len622_score93_45DUF1129/PF06570_11/0_19DUF1129/PF06570_11/60DUF1129/PF06570_11/33DUF1129/PF06570_11/9e02DUF4179/PF13786_6/4_1DUF4179/PF13786_6/5_4e02_NODE_734_length_2301_cov_6_823165_g690_i01051970
MTVCAVCRKLVAGDPLLPKEGFGSSLSLLGVTLAVVGAVVACVSWVATHRRHTPCRQQEDSKRTWACWWTVAGAYCGLISGAAVVLDPAVAAWFDGWLGVVVHVIAVLIPILLHTIFGPKVANITSYGGVTYIYFIRHRLGPTFSHLFACWGFFLTCCSVALELANVGRVCEAIDPRFDPWVSAWILSLILCVVAVLQLSSWSLTFRSTATLAAAGVLLCALAVSVSLSQTASRLSETALAAATQFSRRNQSGTFFVLLLTRQLARATLQPFLWTLLYSSKDVTSWQTGVVVGGTGCVILTFVSGVSGVIAWSSAQEGILPLSLPILTAFSSAVWSCVLVCGILCLSLVSLLCDAAGCVCVAQALLDEHRWNRRLATPVLVLVLLFSILMRFYGVGSLPAINNVALYGSCLLAPCFLLSLWAGVSTEGCAWGVGAGALTISAVGWARLRSFKGGFSWWSQPSCLSDDLSYTTSDCMSTWLTIGVAVAVTTVWSVSYSQWQFRLFPCVYENQVRRLMIIQAIAPVDPLKLNASGDDGKDVSSNFAPDYGSSDSTPFWELGRNPTGQGDAVSSRAFEGDAALHVSSGAFEGDAGLDVSSSFFGASEGDAVFHVFSAVDGKGNS